MLLVYICFEVRSLISILDRPGHYEQNSKLLTPGLDNDAAAGLL
jgi:hypothetical protein